MSEHKIKTTVVGSFPSRPSGNAFMKNYREGGDPYLASLEDAVNNQVASGIDIISDGQTRNDMVSLFATKLKGIRMKARPVVIGPVEFRNHITLDDLKLARELMGDRAELKGIITGAYTMARSCIDQHYGNLEELSFAFADALVAEAGGVPQAALHTDVDAICHAFDAVRPVAARLGVDSPKPRLAGLAYVLRHVSPLYLMCDPRDIGLRQS